MSAPYRLAGTAIALALLLALGACARVTYISTQTMPARNTIAGSETSFELAPDGPNHCRKANGPNVFLGSSNQQVTWKIKNLCGKDAFVYIEKFKVKHSPWYRPGRNPFSKRPGETKVINQQEATITAIVLDAQQVNEDEKGLNLYRYEIRIVTVDGHEKKHDPEIVIDWP